MRQPDHAIALPLPKTVCLPFSHDVMTVVMKNWDPFVLGPAFAMLNSPGVSCLRVKFSSCNITYTAHNPVLLKVMSLVQASICQAQQPRSVMLEGLVLILQDYLYKS